VSLPRVISLALFRPLPGEHRHADALDHFPRFLPALLRAARELFRGWEVWVHHDDGLDSCYYGSTLKLLARQGYLRLVYCGPVAALCHAMLWRLYPALDGAAEHVLCRDLDSLATPRERHAVEGWLRSGRALHVMHDHAHHASPGARAFIPGGMFGLHVPAFRHLTGLTNMRQLLVHAQQLGVSLHAKGDDQVVLNSLLPPLIGDDYLLHAYDPGTGHAAVDPVALPGVDKRALARGNALTPYTGGVFDVAPVVAFYNQLPSSNPIHWAEQQTGEAVPH